MKHFIIYKFLKISDKVLLLLQRFVVEENQAFFENFDGLWNTTGAAKEPGNNCTNIDGRYKFLGALIIAVPERGFLKRREGEREKIMCETGSKVSKGQ